MIRNIGHEILEGLKEIKRWQRSDMRLKTTKLSLEEYVPFLITDYIDNPIALARIKAGITQEKLARLMKVSTAYIRDLESKDVVEAELIKKVKVALRKLKK